MHAQGGQVLKAGSKNKRGNCRILQVLFGSGFFPSKKEWLQDEKLEHGKQVYLPTAESTHYMYHIHPCHMYPCHRYPFSWSSSYILEVVALRAALFLNTLFGSRSLESR